MNGLVDTVLTVGGTPAGPFPRTRARTRCTSQPPKNRAMSAVERAEGSRRPSSSGGGGLMARSSSLLQGATGRTSRLGLRKRTPSTSGPAAVVAPTPVSHQLAMEAPARAASTGPFADLIALRKRASTRQRRASAQVVASPPPPPLPGKGKESEFSTADRTILEELRRGLSVRSSQFVFKHGRKHHAYAPTAAPYPRNYERDVVDHDVWEMLFTRQLSKSLTFHVFLTPPQKVLDLGCGTGAWILECARVWRETEFVGMDLVPLHPDVRGDLGARIRWVQDNALDGLPFSADEFDFVHVKRLARGVPEDRWDHLLDEIARVMRPGGALEILEEDLFFPGQPRECSPPPSPAPLTSSTTSLPVPPSPFKRRTPSLPPQRRAPTRDAPELHFLLGSPSMTPMAFAPTPALLVPPRKPAISTTSAPSHAHTHSGPVSPAGPASPASTQGQDRRGLMTKRPSFIRTLSNPASKRAPQAVQDSDKDKGLVRKPSAVLLRADGTVLTEGRGGTLGVNIPSATLFGPDDTSADGLLSPESETGTHQTYVASPVQVSPSTQPSLATLLHPTPPTPSSKPNSISRTTKPYRHSSNASLSSVASYASHDGLSSHSRTPSKLRVPSTPRASSSTDLPSSTLGSSYGLIPLLPEDREQRNSGSGSGSIVGAEARKVDERRRMGLQDPRDHSVLEYIYTEMHAERFINLAPLSLLANSLPLYFKDVRTHPPITFMFPPRPSSPSIPAPRAANDETNLSGLDFPDYPGFTSSDTDDDYDIPRGRAPTSTDGGTLKRKQNGARQLTMRAPRKILSGKDGRPVSDSRPLSAVGDSRPMSSWADHGHGAHAQLSGGPTLKPPPPPNTSSHIRHPHPRSIPSTPTSPQLPSSATPTASAFSPPPHPPVPRSSSPEGGLLRGREIWAQTQPFVVLDSSAPNAVPVPSARRASQSPGIARKGSRSPGTGLGRKTNQSQSPGVGLGRKASQSKSSARRKGSDATIPDEVVGRVSTSSEVSTASQSTTTVTVTGPIVTPRTSFASEFDDKVSFPTPSPSALAPSNSFSSVSSASTTASTMLHPYTTVSKLPGIETSAPRTGASAGFNVNRLPNKTLAFDLQSLNLHLSIRVSELVACREAMWEWLVRWQVKEREKGVMGGGGGWIEEELRELNRAEFEALLARFEMDMQDNISLDARIASTFAWPRPSSITRTPERKQFDAACAKWAEHVKDVPIESAERAAERARMGGRMSRTIRVFCAWK